MASMRVSPMLLCAFFSAALLLLAAPAAARFLRADDHVRRLSEEDFKSAGDSVRHLSEENFKTAGDSVPTSANMAAYERSFEWARFQEQEVTQDYGTTPAAANPSVPCCTP